MKNNAFDVKLYNTWNVPKPSAPTSVYSDLYLFSDFDLYNNSLNNLIINLDCSFIDASSNRYNFTISSLVPANFEVGDTVVFRKFGSSSEIEISISIPQDRSGFKIGVYQSAGKFDTNGNTIKIYYSNFISKNNNHLINGFNDWKLDKIYTREFNCSYWDPNDGGEDDIEIEYNSDNYIAGVNDIKIIVYTQYRKNSSSYYSNYISTAGCLLYDECILSKEFIQNFKQIPLAYSSLIYYYNNKRYGFRAAYDLSYYRTNDKIDIDIYASAEGEVLPANSGMKFTVYCYYK